VPRIRTLAILDDYQGVALALGPWARLPHLATTVFRETLTDPDALAARLAPFDAALLMRERTPMPAALIERLPNLRLLVTTGERNRAVDSEACAARGIVFCGTEGVGAPTVDLTWGLILGLARGIPEQQAGLRAGAWQGLPLGLGLEGRTLGLLGLGKLGARVARVGQAFGMRTVAWSQNLSEARAAEAGCERVGKRDLFARADVLSIHLVLSERSRGLVGASELAAMRPGALLVNTSRGPIVDQPALLAALAEGRIRAGLDVFDEEPLPPGHPLLAAPNTLLTPHLGYVTEENYRTYFAGAVEAIEAFEAGRPVRRIA
jgi:phosphoglycerate dehydrogenase-like enzyme